jgi:hypothetical protein
MRALGFVRIVCVLCIALLPLAARAQFLYFTSNGTITIYGYNGPEGVMSIPNTVNGLPVTGIYTMTFQNKTSLTSVALGTNILSIGNQAFQNCAGLRSVTLLNKGHAE